MVQEATDEALGVIAMKFPMLGRRQLGIKYAEAYRRAMLVMRTVGLISAYVPGERPRYFKHATPRQILRLRSSRAQKGSAE